MIRIRLSRLILLGIALLSLSVFLSIVGLNQVETSLAQTPPGAGSGPGGSSSGSSDDDDDGDATDDSTGTDDTSSGPTDSDGDGTPDAADFCPTASGPDWNNGCPANADSPSIFSLPALPDDGPCVAATLRATPEAMFDPLNGTMVGVVFPDDIVLVDAVVPTSGRSGSALLIQKGSRSGAVSALDFRIGGDCSRVTSTPGVDAPEWNLDSIFLDDAQASDAVRDFEECVAQGTIGLGICLLAQSSTDPLATLDWESILERVDTDAELIRDIYANCAVAGAANLSECMIAGLPDATSADDDDGNLLQCQAGCLENAATSQALSQADCLAGCLTSLAPLEPQASIDFDDVLDDIEAGVDNPTTTGGAAECVAACYDNAATSTSGLALNAAECAAGCITAFAPAAADDSMDWDDVLDDYESGAGTLGPSLEACLAEGSTDLTVCIVENTLEPSDGPQSPTLAEILSVCASVEDAQQCIVEATRGHPRLAQPSCELMLATDEFAECE